MFRSFVSVCCCSCPSRGERFKSMKTFVGAHWGKRKGNADKYQRHKSIACDAPCYRECSLGEKFRTAHQQRVPHELPSAAKQFPRMMAMKQEIRPKNGSGRGSREELASKSVSRQVYESSRAKKSCKVHSEWWLWLCGICVQLDIKAASFPLPQFTCSAV